MDVEDLFEGVLCIRHPQVHKATIGEDMANALDVRVVKRLELLRVLQRRLACLEHVHRLGFMLFDADDVPLFSLNEFPKASERMPR